MTSVRVLLAAMLALALVAPAAGCFGPNFAAVKPGMMFTDVERIMGKPRQRVLGDNVDLGKTLWVYPQGKVLFDGCTVIKVEPAAEEPAAGEPPISK